MRKKLILLIIILVASSLQVRAEDDWTDIYDGYKEADYGKTVSEKEFNDAIKTKEKYVKKGKKKPKKGEADKKEQKITLDVPSSPDQLFTLTTDVNYNGQVIPRGFYLVNAVNKNDKYFIRLTRGENRIIAEIEANAIEKINIEKKVFSEIMENGILKLTYTGNNIILESYLWL